MQNNNFYALKLFPTSLFLLKKETKKIQPVFSLRTPNSIPIPLKRFSYLTGIQ